MKRRIALISVSATTAWMTAMTGQAAAQIPACDAAKPALLSFKGLPEQLITGREHQFGFNDPGISDTGWVNSTVQVQMTMKGEAFFTGSVGEFDLEDKLLFIRSDPGDQPLTVTASYTEYRMYPDPQAGDCARTISQTMTARSGRPMPRPAVRGNDEEGKFALSDAADEETCVDDFAPTPLAVQVRMRGARRWTTMTSADQCFGFDRPSARGAGFRLQRESVLPTLVYFQPRTPARSSVKDFQFRIMAATTDDDNNVWVGSRALRRGMLRVKTSHTPSRRVYAMNGDRINDEYWNYCVNEAKKTWMHNGNAYCIRPSVTSRYVTVRR